MLEAGKESERKRASGRAAARQQVDIGRWLLLGHAVARKHAHDSSHLSTAGTVLGLPGTLQIASLGRCSTSMEAAGIRQRNENSLRALGPRLTRTMPETLCSLLVEQTANLTPASMASCTSRFTPGLNGSAPARNAPAGGPRHMPCVPLVCQAAACRTWLLSCSTECRREGTALDHINEERCLDLVQVRHQRLALFRAAHRSERLFIRVVVKVPVQRSQRAQPPPAAERATATTQHIRAAFMSVKLLLLLLERPWHRGAGWALAESRERGALVHPLLAATNLQQLAV